MACELLYKAEEDDEELDVSSHSFHIKVLMGPSSLCAQENTLHLQKDEFALSKEICVPLDRLPNVLWRITYKGSGWR